MPQTFSADSNYGNKLRSVYALYPCKLFIKLIIAAYHLLYADNVIALDQDGRITQHGSYSDLMGFDGYIRMLSDNIHQVNSVRAPDIVLDDETLRELNLDDQPTDLSRRTGDWTVYRFYFQNIGWPLLSIFLACCVLFILGLSFPRKLQQSCLNICFHALLISTQKSGCSGGLVPMSSTPTNMFIIGWVYMWHLVSSHF